jgi:hypothetical protein
MDGRCGRREKKERGSTWCPHVHKEEDEGKNGQTNVPLQHGGKCPLLKPKVLGNIIGDFFAFFGSVSLPPDDDARYSYAIIICI